MPSRDYYESLWRELPEDLEPADLDLRLAFLLGRVPSGARVLDLGCGEGHFAAALLEQGASVLAADVAGEALRRAHVRHPELELLLLDPDGGLPLEDSSFDVVWAGEVIEHVADTSGWLSEVRRVLRSGGLLLLSTPSLGPAQLLAAALSPAAFAARFEPRSEHLHHYSAATLRGLLAEFGFGDVSVRAAGGPPGARRVLLARAVRSRF